MPTVSKALIDPLPEVREAAADTFSNLHANIGQRALEDILPALLRKLVGQSLLCLQHFIYWLVRCSGSAVRALDCGSMDRGSSSLFRNLCNFVHSTLPVSF